MFFSPCPACGMLCGDSPATHTSSLPKLSPCRCGFGGRLAYCSLASIRRGATCSVLRAKLTRPRATPTSTTARNAGPSGPPMGRVTSAPTRGCFLATAASVSATRNRATRMMARGFCSRPGGASDGLRGHRELPVATGAAYLSAGRRWAAAGARIPSHRRLV